MESRFLLRGTGRPPLSHAVVMDWLNSFQYHFDSEKRVKVLEDLGPFADFQDGMNVALFSLVDMVQAVLGVSDVIKTLELCADGTIPEIECPPTYFDQRST